MAMKKVRAHSDIHMVPITPTWAVSYFVHAPMSWTRVLHYYNVLSCLLAISFFVHEQMFFKRKCKHRSRIIHLVYGGESCAVLPFVLLVYTFTEVTKNVVSSPESVPESYKQIIKNVLGQKRCQSALFWEKPHITLVVTSKIKPYRVYVVWVIIWAKNTLYYIIPTSRKTACKPWVQQYVRDRC